MQIYPWIYSWIYMNLMGNGLDMEDRLIRRIPYKDFVYLSRVYPHAMDGLSQKNS